MGTLCILIYSEGLLLYVITGILMFSSFHKHLLMTFLALEYIIFAIRIVMKVTVEQSG
jgi:hypothetical protein